MFPDLEYFVRVWEGLILIYLMFAGIQQQNQFLGFSLIEDFLIPIQFPYLLLLCSDFLFLHNAIWVVVRVKKCIDFF